jgi:hypothetical protein
MQQQQQLIETKLLANLLMRRNLWKELRSDGE